MLRQRLNDCVLKVQKFAIERLDIEGLSLSL
jgi:hypothetical protein